MAYTLEEAKQLIIKAGLELVKKKLIARTWGNISARLSDEEFLITPSGVPYDQVNENNLVVVKISDCSYSGNIKPSGEKKVHAAIYEIRKDVNFILHTHQKYATAVSVDGVHKDFAPVADYALPGTKQLVKNVRHIVETYRNMDTFLMARHGALIVSSNYEDAFTKAIILEDRAQKLYKSVKTDKPIHIEIKPYLDDYAQMFGFSSNAVEEDAEAIRLIKEKNTLAALYQKNPKPMSRFDVFIQHLVYKKKYAKLKDSNK